MPWSPANTWSAEVEMMVRGQSALTATSPLNSSASPTVTMLIPILLIV